MTEKKDDKATWEEFVVRMREKLPTGQVIHDEIGLSWEVIAQNVYYCSRNDVEKYAKLLPREYYTVKQEAAAKTVLDIWDKAIHVYQKTLPHQEQRRADVAKRWSKQRQKYEGALYFDISFRRPTDDELEYIRWQTEDKNYTPVYDGEYNIQDAIYDGIAARNKQALLKQIKPVLEGIRLECTKRLSAFYDGYTAFSYIPLVACISIMTESAKQQLKETIDDINADTKEQLQRAIYHSKALVACAEICQGDNAKLRGGQKTTWNSFEEKTKGALYLHVLRMAALVLVFHIWEWSGTELEILMEHAFCLSRKKQREIQAKAKELLDAGGIQPPHTLEEIRPFIEETAGEEKALEEYFKLEVASNVYEM